jgi:hypothetical protein
VACNSKIGIAGEFIPFWSGAIRRLRLMRGQPCAARALIEQTAVRLRRFLQSLAKLSL